MSRILVVEDDRNSSRFLQLELEHENYEVLTAFDGRTGLEMALREKPDLVVLDIMLPQLSGTEVCRRIRMESDVPIIMLTAMDGVPNRVAGLDMGADDYMTKPYAIEELLARIRTNLRRHPAEPEPKKPEILTIGQLTLNPVNHTVTFGGEDVRLTNTEFELLRYLMQHKGEAVTREELLRDVWGYDYSGDTNVVDVYIRYLRTKLDQRFNIHTINTIRSVGYLFCYE